MAILLAFLLALQAAPAAASNAQTDAEAAVIANCDAHKFETVVHTIVAGKMHSSRVKLCGKVGQTNSDWLATLKDAVDKVETNASMSADAKDQVVAALKLEIAKVSGGAGQASAAIPAAPSAVQRTPAIGQPGSALVTGPSLGGPVEYSVLPPLPAPLPAATAVATVAAVPTLPAPRLSFRCVATTSLGAEGACDLLERDTLMTVRADENIPAGTSLRFLRRGDNRAEVDLVQLKRGQAQRFALPPRVCQGVTGSRVEIQIVRAGKGAPQVVDTRGPFELRC